MTLDINKFTGSLLGLAIGDALGTTLELCEPNTFTPIDDILGGGVFNLKPGYWTDDTSMALCLAESLISKNGFDAQDQMDRYSKWYKDGYLSSTGECFGIGATTCKALERYQSYGEPYSSDIDPLSAGNGSLMRLSPIPLAFHRNFEQTVKFAALSSKTTHGSQDAVDACKYYAALIYAALNGVSKSEMLEPYYSPIDDYWVMNPVVENVDKIIQGLYKIKNPPEINGSGYVVDSMEAALWALYNSDNFKDGALLAVNLGNDADTTGAVYAQLAGAYYGFDAIPKSWRDIIHENRLIIDYATKLHTLSYNL